MTKDETRKLLVMINALFPTFKVDNPESTVDSWHFALREYDANKVFAGLQIFVKTSNSAFAPSVPQIISAMHAPAENDALSEGEAWALVKKAIRDGYYHSEERFAELPPLIQQAVGGSNMIRQWAQIDSDEVNTVIMSNFQRNYRTIVHKHEFDAKVPATLSDAAKGIEDTSAQKNIGKIMGGLHDD